MCGWARAAGHREANLRAAAETAGAILPRYLTHKRDLIRPRSYANLEHDLTTHAKPLHGLPLAKVGRREVQTCSRYCVQQRRLCSGQGPGLAERPVFLVHGGGACRGQSGDRYGEPWQGRAARSGAHHAEIATVWAALGDDDFGNLNKLLLLTGQRREELSSLRWSEIDFEHGLIRLPETGPKTGSRMMSRCLTRYAPSSSRSRSALGVI